jgi:hypothetical protein
MERDPPICNLGTHLATVDLSPGNLHQYPEKELSEWFVALLNICLPAISWQEQQTFWWDDVYSVLTCWAWIL